MLDAFQPSQAQWWLPDPPPHPTRLWQTLDLLTGDTELAMLWLGDTGQCEGGNITSKIRDIMEVSILNNETSLSHFLYCKNTSRQGTGECLSGGTPNKIFT